MNFKGNKKPAAPTPTPKPEEPKPQPARVLEGVVSGMKRDPPPAPEPEAPKPTPQSQSATVPKKSKTTKAILIVSLTAFLVALIIGVVRMVRNREPSHEDEHIQQPMYSPHEMRAMGLREAYDPSTGTSGFYQPPVNQ